MRATIEVPRFLSAVSGVEVAKVRTVLSSPTAITWYHIIPGLTRPGINHVPCGPGKP